MVTVLWDGLGEPWGLAVCWGCWGGGGSLSWSGRPHFGGFDTAMKVSRGCGQRPLSKIVCGNGLVWRGTNRGTNSNQCPGGR